MPLRHLLRILVNNEQLVQKIAESYPIRRAAQLTAYFMQRGNEQIEKVKESDAVIRAQQKLEQNTEEMLNRTGKASERAGNAVTSFFEKVEKEWQKEKKRIDSEYKDDKKK